jgi:hypothetical protein
MGVLDFVVREDDAVPPWKWMDIKVVMDFALFCFFFHALEAFLEVSSAKCVDDNNGGFVLAVLLPNSWLDRICCLSCLHPRVSCRRRVFFERLVKEHQELEAGWLH